MIAVDVFQSARGKALKIATAESCTGGMVSAALTDIAGSSEIFDCGFVTYSNEAKIRLLNVHKETLAAFGAVSEQVALEMAQGALENSNADLAVSITGIAGPGGSESKPEGRVCFGIASTNASAFAFSCDFGALGRAEVRIAARDYALALLKTALST